MLLRQIILLVGLAVPGGCVRAAVIASTGFENEVVTTERYTSLSTLASLDPAVAVPLPNATSPTITINSTAGSSVAGDLGFTAAWYNTLGDTGFAEGDLLGVRSETFLDDPYTEGVSGYTISDPEGTLALTFDAVNVSAHTGVTVSIDYLLNGSIYEAEDTLVIKVDTDVGVFSMIDTSATGVEGVLPEDVFTTATVAIPDSATTATLSVLFTSTSNAEFVVLDAVRFDAEGLVLPEPAGLPLLASSLFLLRRWRA